MFGEINIPQSKFYGGELQNGAFEPAQASTTNYIQRSTPFNVAFNLKHALPSYLLDQNGNVAQQPRIIIIMPKIMTPIDNAEDVKIAN